MIFMILVLIITRYLLAHGIGPLSNRLGHFCRKKNFAFCSLWSHVDKHNMPWHEPMMPKSFDGTWHHFDVLIFMITYGIFFIIVKPWFSNWSASVAPINSSKCMGVYSALWLLLPCYSTRCSPQCWYDIYHAGSLLYQNIALIVNNIGTF